MAFTMDSSKVNELTKNVKVEEEVVQVLLEKLCVERRAEIVKIGKQSKRLSSYKLEKLMDVQDEKNLLARELIQIDSEFTDTLLFYRHPSVLQGEARLYNYLRDKSLGLKVAYGQSFADFAYVYDLRTIDREACIAFNQQQPKKNRKLCHGDKYIKRVRNKLRARNNRLNIERVKRRPLFMTPEEQVRRYYTDRYVSYVSRWNFFYRNTGTYLLINPFISVQMKRTFITLYQQESNGRINILGSCPAEVFINRTMLVMKQFIPQNQLLMSVQIQKKIEEQNNLEKLPQALIETFNFLKKGNISYKFKISEQRISVFKGKGRLFLEITSESYLKTICDLEFRQKLNELIVNVTSKNQGYLDSIIDTLVVRFKDTVFKEIKNTVDNALYVLLATTLLDILIKIITISSITNAKFVTFMNVIGLSVNIVQFCTLLTTILKFDIPQWATYVNDYFSQLFFNKEKDSDLLTAELINCDQLDEDQEELAKTVQAFSRIKYAYQDIEYNPVETVVNQSMNVDKLVTGVFAILGVTLAATAYTVPSVPLIKGILTTMTDSDKFFKSSKSMKNGLTDFYTAIKMFIMNETSPEVAFMEEISIWTKRMHDINEINNSYFISNDLNYKHLLATYDFLAMLPTRKVKAEDSSVSTLINRYEIVLAKFLSKINLIKIIRAKETLRQDPVAAMFWAKEGGIGKSHFVTETLYNALAEGDFSHPDVPGIVHPKLSGSYLLKMQTNFFDALNDEDYFIVDDFAKNNDNEPLYDCLHTLLSSTPMTLDSAFIKTMVAKPVFVGFSMMTETYHFNQKQLSEVHADAFWTRIMRFHFKNKKYVPGMSRHEIPHDSTDDLEFTQSFKDSRGNPLKSGGVDIPEKKLTYDELLTLLKKELCLRRKNYLACMERKGNFEKRVISPEELMLITAYQTDVLLENGDIKNQSPKEAFGNMVPVVGFFGPPNAGKTYLVNSLLETLPNLLKLPIVRVNSTNLLKIKILKPCIIVADDTCYDELKWLDFYNSIPSGSIILNCSNLKTTYVSSFSAFRIGVNSSIVSGPAAMMNGIQAVRNGVKKLLNPNATREQPGFSRRVGLEGQVFYANQVHNIPIGTSREYHLNNKIIHNVDKVRISAYEVAKDIVKLYVDSQGLVDIKVHRYPTNLAEEVVPFNTIETNSEVHEEAKRFEVDVYIKADSIDDLKKLLNSGLYVKQQAVSRGFEYWKKPSEEVHNIIFVSDSVTKKFPLSDDVFELPQELNLCDMIEIGKRMYRNLIIGDISWTVYVETPEFSCFGKENTIQYVSKYDLEAPSEIVCGESLSGYTFRVLPPGGESFDVEIKKEELVIAIEKGLVYLPNIEIDSYKGLVDLQNYLESKFLKETQFGEEYERQKSEQLIEENRRMWYMKWLERWNKFTLSDVGTLVGILASIISIVVGFGMIWWLVKALFGKKDEHSCNWDKIHDLESMNFWLKDQVYKLESIQDRYVLKVPEDLVERYSDQEIREEIDNQSWEPKFKQEVSKKFSIVRVKAVNQMNHGYQEQNKNFKIQRSQLTSKSVNQALEHGYSQKSSQFQMKRSRATAVKPVNQAPQMSYDSEIHQRVVDSVIGNYCRVGANGLYYNGLFVCGKYILTLLHGTVEEAYYRDTFWKVKLVAKIEAADLALYEVQDKTFASVKDIRKFIQPASLETEGNFGEVILPNVAVTKATPASVFKCYQLAYKFFPQYTKPFITDGVPFMEGHYEVSLLGSTNKTPTKAGDCGSVYCTYSKKHNSQLIIGLHKALSSQNMYFVSITKEMVDSMIEIVVPPLEVNNQAFNQKWQDDFKICDESPFETVTLQLPGMEPEELLVDEAKVQFLESLVEPRETWPLFDNTNKDVTLKYLGQSLVGPSGATKEKHNHFNTAWSDSISHIIPIEVDNSVLITPQETDVPLIESNQGTKSILFTQLNYMNDPQTVPIDIEQKIDSVVQQLIPIYADVYSGEKDQDGVPVLRELNGKELFNGIYDQADPLAGYLDRIEEDSSPGFWASYKYQVTKTKDLLTMVGGKDGNRKILRFTNDVRYRPLYNELKFAIKSAEKGKRVLDFFKDCLKDELLPLEKIRQLKTRCFQADGFVQKMMVRYFYGRLMAKFNKHHITMSCQKGIDVEKEFSILMQQFRKVGVAGECGDFKRFDKHLLAPLLRGSMKVLTALIKRDHPDEEEKWDNICKVVSDCLIKSFHYANRHVYMATRGNKSGFMMTTEVNSTGGDIMYYVCCIDLLLEMRETDRPCKPTVGEIMKHTKRVSLGDDSCHALSPAVEKVFSFSNIARKMMQLFAIEYTLPTKGEGSVEVIPLDKFNFLSCDFLRDDVNPSLYHPALKKTSINRQMHFMTQESQECIKMMMESVLNAAVHHDKNYYDQCVKALKIIKNYVSVYWSYDIRPINGIPTYAEMRNFTRQKMLGEGVSMEATKFRIEELDQKTVLGQPNSLIVASNQAPIFKFYEKEINMFPTIIRENLNTGSTPSIKTIQITQTTKTRHDNGKELLSSDVNPTVMALPKMLRAKFFEICINIHLEFVYKKLAEEPTLKEIIIFVPKEQYALTEREPVLWKNNKFFHEYQGATIMCNRTLQETLKLVPDAHNLINKIHEMYKTMLRTGHVLTFNQDVITLTREGVVNQAPLGVESGDTSKSAVVTTSPAEVNPITVSPIQGLNKIFQTMNVTGKNDSILSHLDSKFLAFPSVSIKTEAAVGDVIFDYNYGDLVIKHPYLNFWLSLHRYTNVPIEVTCKIITSQTYQGEILVGMYRQFKDNEKVNFGVFESENQNWKVLTLGENQEFSAILSPMHLDKQTVSTSVLSPAYPMQRFAAIINSEISNPFNVTVKPVVQYQVWVKPLGTLTSVFDTKHPSAFPAIAGLGDGSLARFANIPPTLGEFALQAGETSSDVFMILDGKFGDNLIPLMRFNEGVLSSMSQDMVQNGRMFNMSGFNKDSCFMSAKTGILWFGRTPTVSPTDKERWQERHSGAVTLEQAEKFVMLMDTNILRVVQRKVKKEVEYSYFDSENHKTLKTIGTFDIAVYKLVEDGKLDGYVGVYVGSDFDKEIPSDLNYVSIVSMTNLFKDLINTASPWSFLKTKGASMGSNFVRMQFVNNTSFENVPLVTKTTATLGGNTTSQNSLTRYFVQQLGLNTSDRFIKFNLTDPISGYPLFEIVINRDSKSLFIRSDIEYAVSRANLKNSRITNIITSQVAIDIPTLSEREINSRVIDVPLYYQDDKPFLERNIDHAVNQGNVFAQGLLGGLGGAAKGAMDWQMMLSNQDFMKALTEQKGQLGLQQQQMMIDYMRGNTDADRALRDKLGMAQIENAQWMSLTANDIQQKIAQMQAETQKEIQESRNQNNIDLLNMKLENAGALSAAGLSGRHTEKSLGSEVPPPLVESFRKASAPTSEIASGLKDTAKYQWQPTHQIRDGIMEEIDPAERAARAMDIKYVPSGFKGKQTNLRPVGGEAQPGPSSAIDHLQPITVM